MAVDSPGLVLWAGEYELKELIARGSMATVYRAYARSLDTMVAIKVLSPRLAQDPSFRQRFHSEAKGIAGLHHPGIIEVHHFGEEDGLLYIAMRYVRGGTLKERMQDLGGVMDLRSAARLIAQISLALQYAHDSGRLHLDVKPANVLLGNADWPLLSDFGISRTVDGEWESDQRIAGTAAYMPPEQWQAAELNGQADQYALGVMLYELVTGWLPFQGESPAELKARHLTESPPRPGELNPGIPPAVEDVVLRALKKRPEDRFPTIGEFGTALVDAVEQTRGMQLETKQAIVSLAPNLVALFVLSLVAPLLVALPRSDLPLFRTFTLNWPISLAIALMQGALLLEIRWHIIGLVARMLGALVDAVNPLGRVYVRLRADPEASLRVQSWRNALVGSAEGFVNIAYLFLAYQIVGPTLIKTSALLLDPGAEVTVATAVAALVLLVALAIILKIYRTGGPVIAVGALALCWGLVSVMPVVDRPVYGQMSLQWLAKLIVGLAVSATLLAVRERVQRGARELAFGIGSSEVKELRRGQMLRRGGGQPNSVEPACDGLVDLLYLVAVYSIVALPLDKVLGALIGETPAAVAIAGGVLSTTALLVDRLRVTSGVLPSALGLLICSPMLSGLPLFERTQLGGASFRWAAHLVIGVGMLAIFLALRRKVQAFARVILVPTIDVQLGSPLPSRSEQQEVNRQRELARATDGLVDLMYLLAGYLAIVRPVTGALAGVPGLGWASLLLHGIALAAAIYVAREMGHLLLPALRSRRVPT